MKCALEATYRECHWQTMKIRQPHQKSFVFLVKAKLAMLMILTVLPSTFSPLQWRHLVWGFIAIAMLGGHLLLYEQSKWKKWTIIAGFIISIIKLVILEPWKLKSSDNYYKWIQIEFHELAGLKFSLHSRAERFVQCCSVLFRFAF